MQLSTTAGFRGWIEVENPSDPSDKIRVDAATFNGGGASGETGVFHDHDARVTLEGQKEREDITITQGLSRTLAAETVQRLDRWVGVARCTATRAEIIGGVMAPNPWRYTGVLKGVSQSDRQKGESGAATLTVVMACDADLA